MSAWFMDIPVTRAVFAGVSATEFHRVQKASSSDWASCKTWWAPTFFRWRVPVYLSKPCNTYSQRFLLHQSAGIVKHCCRMTQPSRIYWESVCRTAAWQPQYINHCKAIAQAQTSQRSLSWKMVGKSPAPTTCPMLAETTLQPPTAWNLWEGSLQDPSMNKNWIPAGGDPPAQAGASHVVVLKVAQNWICQTLAGRKPWWVIQVGSEKPHSYHIKMTHPNPPEQRANQSTMFNGVFIKATPTKWANPRIKFCFHWV